MYEYRATVDRIVDGDTVDFIVQLGFNISVKIRARFAGVDTPERGHPDWSVASSLCRELLVDKALANDRNDMSIIIRTSKTGKYGRWIVHIDGVTDKLAERWPYKK